MRAGRAMRWWHFGAAAAVVGIGIVALTGNVAAQTSTNPTTAAPTLESTDSLNAEGHPAVQRR
jgi:hypothetical protein